MRRSSSEGRFVVLEGVEGAGKTTQAALIADWLDRVGVPYVLAREPGGTEVGEAIREVVQERTDLDIPTETELLLFVAARAAFVQRIVRPALDRGELVIADRFSWSTLAYQGYGRGLDLEAVRAVDAFGTGGLEPDLYLIFDLPVEQGRRRQMATAHKDDRMEMSGQPFLERVRRGYREMAAQDPTAEMIDALGTPEQVFERVRDRLVNALPETFRDAEVSMDTGDAKFRGEML